ncbi:hypothetical protein [Yersinia enterocolitica]|uniref:hypothetical protein n=1 Tax=Yersinia enterocolitica TaxID=630 RepID=UPI00398D0CEF
MNNLEERIENLKANIALSELIGSDELTVTVSDLSVLIAQLEAAQKELFDLHNQEFQQRLANAEHQLYMKDLAIHNIKASRKAQFRKRLAAEAELSAANEKLKVVALLEELPTPDMRGDEPFKEALDYVSGWNACVSKIKAAGFTAEGE